MMPRVVEAAGATRGMMVTYGGVPVVTPYFAHSNGRTRSWQSVWGGTTHPWLVSVTTTYDAAHFKQRSGHGVGMSGWDASHRATEESIDFRTLLQYYYKAVDIIQWYE
jgi:peptidoglycan hydrolase-like amidase